MHLLQPHEVIHRVDQPEPRHGIQYGEFAPADEAAYAAAYSIIKRLDVLSVAIWRLANETQVFVFTLWRIGMVGSGRFTAIVYHDEKESALEYYALPDQVLDLNAPNWFALRSSSD